jgi:hypothetical protein
LEPVSVRPALFGEPLSVDVLRELLAVQRATLDELRGIRADLRRQVIAAPLADRLLAAVRGVMETAPFTAGRLLALADSPLSTRLELRAVVEDIVRGDLDQAGAGRVFGRWLARNSQHEAAGLRLVSLGKSRDGFVYRIELATKTRGARNWADELST